MSTSEEAEKKLQKGRVVNHFLNQGAPTHLSAIVLLLAFSGISFLFIINSNEYSFVGKNVHMPEAIINSYYSLSSNSLEHAKFRDEYLLDVFYDAEAEKHGIEVSDQEIEQSIKKSNMFLEKNKFSEEKLKNFIKKFKLSIENLNDFFRIKVRAERMKSIFANYPNKLNKLLKLDKIEYSNIKIKTKNFLIKREYFPAFFESRAFSINELKQFIKKNYLGGEFKEFEKRSGFIIKIHNPDFNLKNVNNLSDLDKIFNKSIHTLDSLSNLIESTFNLSKNDYNIDFIENVQYGENVFTNFLYKPFKFDIVNEDIKVLGIVTKIIPEKPIELTEKNIEQFSTYYQNYINKKSEIYLATLLSELYNSKKINLNFLEKVCHQTSGLYEYNINEFIEGHVKNLAIFTSQNKTCVFTDSLGATQILLIKSQEKITLDPETRSFLEHYLQQNKNINDSLLQTIYLNWLYKSYEDNLIE